MYNEQCEKLGEEYANEFIMIFNELDKYFDTLVQDNTDKFMPYNEKIKYIAQGKTSVALFIKKYEQKLKYFGEIRNHIIHGMQIDGKYYDTPSFHGVEELKKCKNAIIQPITVSSIYKKNVYICQTTDSLKDVMITMKNFGYTHVPVYNEHRILQGVLTQSAICERLAYHMQDTSQPIDTVQVGAVNLDGGIERYGFIQPSTPLFSLLQIFEPSSMHEKILGVLLMTEHGVAEEPVIGIITTYDLPAVTEFNFIG